MVRNDCYLSHLLFNFTAFSLTFPLSFTKTSLQLPAIKMIDNEIFFLPYLFLNISIFIPYSLLWKCPLFTTATDRCLELSFVISIVHWCPFLTNSQRQGTIYSVFQSWSLPLQYFFTGLEAICVPIQLEKTKTKTTQNKYWLQNFISLSEYRKYQNHSKLWMNAEWIECE